MSEITTFYSYKGGVGRTMALANVSILLAKWGHNVLVVDWDLEAPGLEHFYKSFENNILKDIETKPGVIDLLQLNDPIKWQDCLIEINVPKTDKQIHFISSGRRNEEYFNKVRSFDIQTYYENKGGDAVEKLRNEWLANYDYVLIDSRTGITEMGGICTIQLPDTIVMLFTATDQGFEGTLDIMKRAGAAQQKLRYDRRKLIFLPIPSKFDATPEFKLSQFWLERFAKDLEGTYYDWLPASINRKEFLELTKIPYIAYFSFGETLPVIEQGVKDPAGLGYAYETLTAMVAHHLVNVDMLYNNRDQYIAEINKFPSLETEVKRNGNGNDLENRLRRLKQTLNINDEPVKVEKNNQVVIECIENIIVPLFEIISIRLNQFDSIFKEKTEIIEFPDVSMGAKTSMLKNMKSYMQNQGFTSAIINSLIYSYTFKNFRTIEKGININVKIFIKFIQLVFEIKSDDGRINENKLYHEPFTIEQSETIANKIVASLLEKIEAAMKE